MARGDRDAGLGGALPRLERADRGGVLRPERRGAAQGTGRPDRRDREQLPPPVVQLRPDLARVARALASGDPRPGGGGRRAQRGAARARQRARAGLQPRDPPALLAARPPHRDPLGRRRLPAEVRARARGVLAPRDRRRRRDARGRRGGGPPVHGPLSLPGAAGPASRRRVAGRERRALRPDPALPRPARRSRARRLLLRRPHRPRPRVRRRALLRGEARPPPRGRVRPGPRSTPSS